MISWEKPVGKWPDIPFFDYDITLFISSHKVLHSRCTTMVVMAVGLGHYVWE